MKVGSKTKHDVISFFCASFLLVIYHKVSNYCSLVFGVRSVFIHSVSHLRLKFLFVFIFLIIFFNNNRKGLQGFRAVLINR